MTSDSEAQVWKNVLLGDVTHEVSERIGKESQPIRIYGVDREKGLTATPKYAAKDISRYKKIEPGMFAYNPMRLNIGSLGFCSSAHEPGVVSPDYVVFRCEPTSLDPLFMHYVTQSQQWEEWTRGAGVGSVRVRIYYRELARMPLWVPPLGEQQAIAAILGSLDDRIEQNRRTSRALEELTRATFKAWFVDFEPVKAKAAGATSFPGMPTAAFAALPDRMTNSPLGLMPQGWAARPLSKVATFLNGLALQKYPPAGDGSDLPVIKIVELRKGSTDGAGLANASIPDAYVVEDGDLLFSWSGTLEVELWFGGRGALNQHLFKVTSDVYPRWFCLHWVRQHLPEFRLIASSKATTMGHIKRGHLDSAQVLVPDDALMQAAHDVIGSLYDLYANLSVETRKLATLRDYLLPRLLSGQVRVRPQPTEMIA